MVGEWLFYINENIPRKLINNEIIPCDIEMIMENGFVLVFTNHHPKTKIIFLIFYLTFLGKQTCQYENVMLIVDFNC